MSDIRSSNPSLPLALIVMRHGRREDSVNPEWQIQARYPFDTPLADTESEIDAAAKRLIEAGRKFDVVYTSPFLRCLETVERLIRLSGCEHVPVFVHKGLSEVHSPHLLFKSRYPTFSQRARLWLWRATYRSHSRSVRERFSIKARVLDSAWPQVPESEHVASIRFQEVMLQLAARHPGQQVLIVSHGKSVQVTHEALNCPERIWQVGFAGFICCITKSGGQSHMVPQSQDPAQATGAVDWTQFSPDPAAPYYNVDFYKTEG